VGLTFVPTPLGNLGDITLRAIDVLREADTIVAEDTRVARRLLTALKIPAPKLLRHDEHSARTTVDAIVQRARQERVVVVTDAGMPGISDPGIDLVRHARSSGVPVEVLPGPSAFVTAAVLSGFDLERFSFEGFVPRAARARRDVFRRALDSGSVSVWYDAPHRVLATLDELARLAPRTPIFLARELTKLHEQQLRGTATEIAAALEKPVRGEIVLVIAPTKIDAATPAHPKGAVDGEIDTALAAGLSIAAIAKSLAARGFGNRREIYARATRRKQRQDGSKRRTEAGRE
jgi:16S rRNA (cytidine1402-2'-O)-methyltransferase